jgi:hypothetical protein
VGIITRPPFGVILDFVVDGQVFCRIRCVHVNPSKINLSVNWSNP